MPMLAEPATGYIPTEEITNGCFETMRAYQGRIFRLDGHLDRLYASAAFLGTSVSPDRRRLARQLTDALARSGVREAVVRVALIPTDRTPLGAVSVSRNRPTRTRPSAARPHIVVRPIQLPTPESYRRGIRVAIVPARKFSVGSITPQAKYSARLGSVLAVQDAQLRGMDEALFLDACGSVTESTASNFGIISRGVMQTPPCWLGLLAGITRQVLFELAQELALPVEEVPLTRHDLYNAEEAFLTSTIKEVLGVTEIDGRRIGTGRPGSFTRRLHQAFQAMVRRELRLSPHARLRRSH